MPTTENDCPIAVTVTTEDPRAKEAPKPRRRIYLATRVGAGRSHYKHNESKRRLAAFFAEHDIADVISIETPSAGIDRSINQMVAHFRKTAPNPDDAFLSWDSDVEGRAGDIAAMFLSPFAVVGAPYPLAAIDWTNVANALKIGCPVAMLPFIASGTVCYFTDEQWAKPLRDVPGTPPKSTWLEVNGMGTGLTLYRRHVFDTFAAHYREAIAYKGDPNDPADCLPEMSMVFHHGRDPDDDTPGGIYCSEDFRFCRMWRAMGGKVHAYEDAVTSHHKAHEFRACMNILRQVVAKSGKSPLLRQVGEAAASAKETPTEAPPPLPPEGATAAARRDSEAANE